MEIKTGNKVFFSETQRFYQWWIWLIISGVDAVFVIGFFKQVIGGHPYGDKPMGDTGLMVLTLIAVLFTAGFASLHLDTQIKEDGIYVKFFPFALKYRRYSWDSMTKCFVKKYFPMGDFGGCGVRFGFPGAGRVLSVSGNKGLQMEFNDKKKLLIGTRKPDEITKVLREMGKWSE